MFYDCLYGVRMVYVAKSWLSWNQSELSNLPQDYTLPSNKTEIITKHILTCKQPHAELNQFWQKIYQKHSVDVIIDWSYAD